MSAGHFAPVAASAIVGGQTAFGPGRVGDGKQGKGEASTSIHDKISRRPGNKAAGTVQINRGKSLSLQARSIGRPAMFKPVRSMSRWLKPFLFGIWGLLLIPLTAPVIEKWLEENVFSDAGGMARTVFPNAGATSVFNNLLALGEQRWFKFAVVFLTGMVIGASLEWLSRKSDEKRAFELQSLGTKFRSLSDHIKVRTAQGWPDNVRDLKPAILSVLVSARKFDLWVPNDHVYQLPDASFLCEYFRCVGTLLEDGHFDKASTEALSWKPFLDKAKLS
jgi:hypothetical protein